MNAGEWFRSRAFQLSGEGSIFADWNRVISMIGLAGLILLGFTCAVIGMGQPAQGEGTALALFMIAAAAFAAGAITGLVLAAFGDEKQIFGSLAAAIQGVIGGFTLSDISKNDGVIRGIFASLSSSAGLVGSGLTVSVVVFFSVCGFIAMYVNKQYLLNPFLAKEQQAKQKAERVLAATKGLQLGLERLEDQPALDQETAKTVRAAVDASKELVEDGEQFRSLPLDTIRAYAKARYLLGELDKAEEILRKARTIAPDDTDLIFHLANVLIRRAKYGEAIAHLNFLVNHPQVRVLTYKLLGYACLFVDGRLNEAESATRKYLCVHPEDVGAKVNLACVYGQRGPQQAVNWERLLPLLDQLRPHPDAMRTIARLTVKGEDFSAWVDHPGFKLIIGPFLSDSVPPTQQASDSSASDAEEQGNPPPQSNVSE